VFYGLISTRVALKGLMAMSFLPYVIKYWSSYKRLSIFNLFTLCW